MPLTAAVLCAWLHLVPRTAAAQAAPAPPPPATEGTAEAAFVGTTGNASTTTLGLGGEIMRRPEPWVIRHKAAFVRNRSQETTTAQVFQYAGRVERVHTPRLSSFGEYGYFRDTFAGVSHRNTLAGGVAITLVDLAPHANTSLKVSHAIRYANFPVAGFENTDTTSSIALVAKFARP